MLEIRYKLKYTGDAADDHRLPAHDGATSLEGITWSFSLLGNYLATGDIRKRGNLDKRVRFYIAPARTGSFTNEVIAFVTEPQSLFLTSILGTVAVGAITTAFTGFVKHAVTKVCGLQDDDHAQFMRVLDRFPSGDLEANFDAIEPAMSRAHNVIGSGAVELNIIKGRTQLLRLDNTTKSYVNSNFENPENTIRVVSVGALNANTGNGRVYDVETNKTIPFTVDKEPRPGTYAVLSSSLDRYIGGLPSNIEITCRETYSHDDRIKKLKIFSANNLKRSAQG